MKKKLIFIMFVIFLFPISVFAKENNVSISCGGTELVSNNELECEITISNLDYVVTSISGKVEVSDNLLLTSSSYDNDNWMILDSEFSVNDINLISENRELKENILIARFKIKAINDKEDVGKIKFSDVVFGDDSYEEHSIVVEDLSINLTYDIKDDNVSDNPPTGSWYIYVVVFIAILMLGVLIYIKKKKNK